MFKKHLKNISILLELWILFGNNCTTDNCWKLVDSIAYTLWAVVCLFVKSLLDWSGQAPSIGARHEHWIASWSADCMKISALSSTLATSLALHWTLIFVNYHVWLWFFVNISHYFFVNLIKQSCLKSQFRVTFIFAAIQWLPVKTLIEIWLGSRVCTIEYLLQ